MDVTGAEHDGSLMTVSVTHREQTTIFTLQGEVTVDGIDPLRQEAQERLEGDGRDFVFDLSQVEFIDSAALEMLVWLQEQAEERLGQVRLAGVPENVEKIMELTRLSSRFEHDADVAVAVENLGI